MSRSLFTQPDRGSLAGHLLYDSYDPEGSVFVHRDGSIGLAWRIGLKDAEVASPDELLDFSARLSDFFRHLPAGAAAQFILRAERGMEEDLSRFDGETVTASTLEELFGAHLDMLRTFSFQHNGASYGPRTLKAYFTLRTFPPLGPAEEKLREDYEKGKERLLEHGRGAENFWTQVGISWTRLGATELTRLLYRTLNPLRAKEAPARAYREDLPIRDQVVRSAAAFDYGSGVLSLDGTHYRVLSMVQIPDKTSPGMVSRPSLAGIGVLDLIPEATLVYNIGVLDDAVMRERLEKRDAFAWRQLQGPRKKLDLVRIKEDAQGALGELLAGRRALTMRLHVILADRSLPALLEKSRSVVATVDRLGLEMVEEDALGLTLFLQALPLMYEERCDRGLKRAFTMISGNVADLLPLYGSFRGTRSPDVLLQNRRGEAVTMSLFDSDVAPHAVVTGVSGAGKSFFMNYLLASVARRAGHVIVLDRGQSYRNLCEILGGQYVVFDPDRPLRINPIGRAEDMTKERLLFVKDILSEMCAQGEEPIRKEERTVIENAVTRAVGRKGQGEVTLSEVYAALLEEARCAPRSLTRDVDRLVLSLKPFVGAGAYAGFFDGPSEIDFTRSFSVFELGELALRKEIAPSLLMGILYNAAAFCGDPANLARKKYLVLDEAWTLLQSPATARFIENALRTYRKLHTAAVMVTQQVSDFAGSAGAAIRANAPNRVFLRQTSETVLAMERLFELSPEVKEAIASLTTAKGRFSEMFIETPGARGVARLVPSPELYAAFSTDGADRARLMKRVEELSRAGDATPLLSAIRGLAGKPAVSDRSQEGP